MLKIQNLSVKIEEKEILKNLSLDIDPKPGETFVLFGPNGSGKSTLLRSIMGLSGYKITQGNIKLNDNDLSKLSVDQRAKEGLLYLYQHPPKIKGVKLEYIITEQTNSHDPYESFKEAIDTLEVNNLYDRDINVGLSGGEMKRVEILTLSLMENKKLFLLDELDSGVDVDNLKKIGKYINKLLKETNSSAILITHTGALLKHLNINKGAVIYKGEIVCQGDAKEIFKCIEKDGYKSCLTCKGEKLS